MVKLLFPFIYLACKEKSLKGFLRKLKWIVAAQLGVMVSVLVYCILTEYSVASVLGISSDPLNLLTNSIQVIGGIVGIVGSFRIFFKWENGDDDINEHMVGYGVTTTFLLLVPVLIRAICY